MASHERRTRIEIGEPDIGFQAGFGFYLGIVVTGIVAVAGVVADASTATLLGVLPSTVTAVAIVGHIYAKRAYGLPEAIGGSRWRRLACYAPAVAFVAPLFISSIDTSAPLVTATIVFALLTAVSGFGLEQMAKNRYLDAITADNPAATWTWYKTGIRNDERVMSAFMIATIIIGLGMAVTGSVVGLVWVVYGTIFLLSAHSDFGGDWYDFDPNDRWNPPEIRAHEAGLRIDKSYRKSFVPWNAIDDVRLTDDELVLERRRFGRHSRWFDIRCDRSGIDDPEGVLADLERVRCRTGNTAVGHRSV
ncbi:PH domain-containing protein [Natrinema salsiterrestre]|uniref:PH domain-containing protein n=1 Tax=Natrinema salsiterrestre TaxID=2950540 RepID=A0A9Q4Q1Z2_9EURY|nr:PH domain-containing protein [Natrinema salsiterrestre]MDF9744783.1 PH domain-containing protein [Natrinema salsiterrestre]